MREVQNSILKYVQRNRYLSPLLKCNVIMALAYPIYLVFSFVPVLSKLWGYIDIFYAIIYLSFFIGIILCFAQNKLIPMDIAFIGMMIYRLFSLQYGINFSRLVYIAFDAVIVYACIRVTKKTSQWAEFKNSTFSNAAKMAHMAESTISGKKNEVSFCPNCGAKLEKNTKFCNSCGSKIG